MSSNGQTKILWNLIETNSNKYAIGIQRIPEIDYTEVNQKINQSKPNKKYPGSTDKKKHVLFTDHIDDFIIVTIVPILAGT